jgi:hypothetical protein
MKIFERIMKGLIALLVLLALLVILPLPMRCHKTSEAIYRPDGDMTMFFPAQYGCYSPLYKEFWLERSWDIKFVGLFIHQDVYPDHPRILTHPILAADVSQDTILMGTAHNVFAGKVITEAGVTDSPTGPRTQYSIEVVSNIKGEVNGVLAVEQEGGMKDGTQYVIENAFPMLEVGSTYLLATRYNESAHTYLIIAHQNAVKLLTSDQSASVGGLKKLVDSDRKIKELEAAYPNEQLIDADLTHSNTRNAFRDLPEEAKAMARMRAEEARASLESGGNMQ